MNAAWFSSHTTLLAAIAGAVVLALAIGCVVWLKRKPRKLNLESCQKKWQEAQSLCADKSTWPTAIINADKLLDEVLKKRHFKGKTMGERLVAAQHEIKNNDMIWFAHKLRNKLVQEEIKKLKKKDVMNALIGIRSALKDLGALQ